MSENPLDNLRYTKEHEWALLQGDNTVVIGITQHAVEQLGDITMVTLPEPGTGVRQGETLGDIDSVKAVSELYAPVTGQVVAKNVNLDEQPELVNAEPYDKGWMLKIKISDPSQLDALMGSAEYAEYVDGLD